MSPEVSVVIPTYNRVADLRRALSSVQQQSFRNWEAMVVDNSSTDGTRQMVESLGDARIRFIEINNEGVVARSRNVGIQAASAEFVALLDSDDWWHPRKLERSLQALRGGADIAYHSMYLVRAADQRFFWFRTRTRDLRAPVFDDLLGRGNALANSSVVIRRGLITSLGGFAEERGKIGYEDFDAWLRAAKVTERFARVPGTLGYYWVGGANLSSPDRMVNNLEDFRANYLADDPAWQGQLPGWFHYGLGRAYYHLGAWQLSLDHMRRARSGVLMPGVRARSIITTLAASLKMHARAN